MSTFFQLVTNGLTVGATYGLLAVGLTLLFGVAQVGNFAQGDIFMWGAFGLFLGTSILGLPFAVAALLAVAVAGAISVASYHGLFRQVSGGTAYVNLIAAVGLGIVLQNLAQVVWGATPRQVIVPMAFERITFGGVTITQQRLFTIFATVTAFVVLELIIRYTRMGKTIRAVAQNREMAQVVGIEPTRVNGQVFLISGILAGMAAFLIGPIYSIFPYMGFMLTLKALSVVIVGGLGDIRGAIVAAFLLGIAESLVAGYIAQEAQDLIAFGLLILVLLIRPEGLFGRAET